MAFPTPHTIDNSDGQPSWSTPTKQLENVDKAGFSLPEIKEHHTHDWHMLEWTKFDKIEKVNGPSNVRVRRGDIVIRVNWRATKFVCLICDEVKLVGDDYEK